MDTLTHIVLGAAIGEVLAGKKLGKKVLLIGAVAQSIPDVDFIAALWLPPADNLLVHRGFTHSILFVLLIVPLLAFVLHRWRVTSALSVWTWMVFFTVQIFIHLFIDAFNAYGVGWFEPFDHSRISFNILFVADPFYSVPLAASFIVLLVLPGVSRSRNRWALVGLVISTFYLGYAIMNKITIDRSVQENLHAQRISQRNYFTTPTPLNNWLWYIVAEDSGGFFIGYRSVFDRQSKIEFTFYPQHDSLLKHFENKSEVHQLKKFAKGFYTLEKWGDTLVFNDLRFGQLVGWLHQPAHFGFHYYLEPELDNKLVLQRGRFAGWNKESTIALIRRIKGRRTDSQRIK
jgi:inner membrane protein